MCRTVPSALTEKKKLQEFLQGRNSGNKAGKVTFAVASLETPGE